MKIERPLDSLDFLGKKKLEIILVEGPLDSQVRLRREESSGPLIFMFS
jgi:hypothetical protein